MTDFDGLHQVLDDLAKAVTSPTLMRGVVSEFQARIDRNENAAWDWLIDHLYPEKRNRRRKFRFASARQRRWFWAQVRQGLIQVPYRRTYRLLRATETYPHRVTDDGFTLRVTVNTNVAPHANYVVGDRQLPGHGDTGWPRLYSAEWLSPYAVEQMGQEFRTVYAGALHGAITVRT